MPLPAWRPMPKTEEDASLPGYREGALIRARHRVLMAIRWRNKEARDEDKKLKRLPEDWHEWMGCPAVDQGYGSPPCTCDLRQSSHPREEEKRERALREKLGKELKFSFKDRKQAALEGRSIATEEPRPLSKILWVKTIDTGGSAPNILPRRCARYGTVKGMGSGEEGARTISRYPTPPPEHESGGASVSTRCLPKRLGRGIRLRLPAWITSRGRALSLMLRGCSPTR